MIKPMILVFPVLKLLASSLGLKPTFSTYSRILFSEASLILFSFAFPFKTNETVVGETPSSLAILLIEFFLRILFLKLKSLKKQSRKIIMTPGLYSEFKLSYFLSELSVGFDFSVFSVFSGLGI